jgi:hypothetical protein
MASHQAVLFLYDLQKVWLHLDAGEGQRILNFHLALPKFRTNELNHFKMIILMTAVYHHFFF